MGTLSCGTRSRDRRFTGVGLRGCCGGPTKSESPDGRPLPEPGVTGPVGGRQLGLRPQARGRGEARRAGTGGGGQVGQGRWPHVAARSRPCRLCAWSATAPRPSWILPTPRAWRAGCVATSTRPTPVRLGCRGLATKSVRAWTAFCPLDNWGLPGRTPQSCAAGGGPGAVPAAGCRTPAWSSRTPIQWPSTSGRTAARAGGGGSTGRRVPPGQSMRLWPGRRVGRCLRAASSRCGRRASGSCWTTGSPSRPPSSCAARASATPSPTPRARGSIFGGACGSVTRTTLTSA